MASVLYVLQSETKLGYLTYLNDHAQERFDIIFVTRGDFIFNTSISIFHMCLPPSFKPSVPCSTPPLPLCAHHGLSFCFISFQLGEGNPAYMKWISDTVPEK